MLSDHEHDISVLSNLGLIERCNKPNTNTNLQYNQNCFLFLYMVLHPFTVLFCMSFMS